MAYEFYMDKVLLPVPPSKLQTKYGNGNKTYTLINEGEINVLKSPKLTEISFDALLPMTEYGFAQYKDGFQYGSTYLEKLEKLKTSREPFQFIVNRMLPNGTLTFETNMSVSLEEYTIKEDVKEGTDVVVSIKLKRYVPYKTKKVKKKKSRAVNILIGVDGKARSNSKNKPNAKNKKYTVKKGDCLWKIAKKFYNDGSKYTIIYKANKKKIKNPNLIYPGQVLKIPDA